MKLRTFVLPKLKSIKFGLHNWNWELTDENHEIKKYWERQDLLVSHRSLEELLRRQQFLSLVLRTISRSFKKRYSYSLIYTE